MKNTELKDAMEPVCMVCVVMAGVTFLVFSFLLVAGSLYVSLTENTWPFHGNAVILALCTVLSSVALIGFGFWYVCAYLCNKS